MDLETLKSKVDIVQVVGEYVNLKRRGRTYVGISPFTNEKVPSFHVIPSRQFYKDFSSGKSGDVIDFLMGINNWNFWDAVNELKKKNGYVVREKEEMKPGVIIKRSRSLQDPKLLNYLAGRKININLARIYCKELYVQFPYGMYPSRQYSVIGFPNKKGGYELRSQRIKKSSSPKYYSEIKGLDKKTVIFEGFINFLSALSYFQRERFKCTVIVLNSIHNLDEYLIGRLKDTDTVFNFLDNDEAANTKISEVEKEGVNLVDCRSYYGMFNDFNDLLKYK